MYYFLHVDEKHSKETAHVSIFDGGTNRLSERVSWRRHDDPCLRSRYVIWCDWIQILGIALRDSKRPTVDDSF